jgi:hypothetical protein
MSISKSSAFSPPPFDELQSLDFVVLRDDFIGGTASDDTVDTGGDLGSWLVTDVAGAADSDVDFISTAATVQNHPGVISLNTGPTTPTAADEASLSLLNLDAFVLPDGEDNAIYFGAIVRFPSVASIEAAVGLFDAANAAGRGVNSVHFELDISNDPAFQGVVVDGSTAVVVDLLETVAVDTWYVLEFAAHEDEVQFRVKGGTYDGRIYRTTDATGIPDDEGLGPVFKVTTETSAEKSMLIDAVMIRARREAISGTDAG